MSNGIAKGVGEELGSLGKQIATDIGKLPAQLMGLDKGTNETTGSGTGGAQKSQQVQKQAQAAQKQIADLARKDEAEKQRKLADARKLIKQFTQDQVHDPGIREKLELEELEKKKQEIEEEKKKVKKILQPVATKPKRGNIFGIKSKQFGGEVGKNVKSQ